MATFAIQTTGEKIVETSYSNRATSENIRIHTPPLSAPFKVGLFVGGTTIHGGGGRGKAIFPLLKSGKRQKVHLSVSTHFVADCSCSQAIVIFAVSSRACLDLICICSSLFVNGLTRFRDFCNFLSFRNFCSFVEYAP